MLQINFLRENRELAIAGLAKRNLDATALIDEALEVDEGRRRAQYSLDQNLAEANKLAAEIGKLFKDGRKEEATAAREKSTALKELCQQLEAEMKEKENALQEILYQLPNVPHTEVPHGKNSADNITVREWGTAKAVEEGLPHWELAKKYNLIDFELGNKITGAGFPVYLGKGAKLQRALIQFFLDNAIEAGYTEVIPPLLVNEDSGYGTGQLPDKDGQMYHATEDNLFLIPTAEVPITNLYRDTILSESDIPVKLVGYTPCFRREAGSYGKDVRGLNRLHQFDKVEIVQIAHPANSYHVLEQMCSYVEGLLKQLELPHRVLRLCGGDMGFTSAMTYDMEVFSAAQKRWLEVSSVSNFETFQAHRLKLRLKTQEGKKMLAHTLNGSALALPRIVAALLENNQTPDGIAIPEKLRPYTGFDIIH